MESRTFSNKPLGVVQPNLSPDQQVMGHKLFILFQYWLPMVAEQKQGGTGRVRSWVVGGQAAVKSPISPPLL